MLPLITIFTALTHDDDQTKPKLLDSQEDDDDNADEDAKWSACSKQFAEGCDKQEHGRWSPDRTLPHLTLDCLLFYMVTGLLVVVVMPINFKTGQLYLPLWVL